MKGRRVSSAVTCQRLGDPRTCILVHPQVKKYTDLQDRDDE